jgi:hypothetical protein
VHRFENLAGVPAPKATEAVTAELRAAGVPTEPLLASECGEVKSAAMGSLLRRGLAVSFVRFWYYYVVRCAPPVDAATANALHYERHPTLPNTHLGHSARLAGHVDGQPPGLYGGKFDLWHVDSPEALKRFVEILRERYPAEDHGPAAREPGPIGSGDRLFYVFSLKWSNGKDLLVWWRHNSQGYTTQLGEAGRFTEAQIAADPRHYNDGERNRVVPVEVAEQFATRMVHANHWTAMLAAADAALGLCAPSVAANTDNE